MVTRSIAQHEIEGFIQGYDVSRIQDWIRQLFEEQETRPEWCFVIEDNGTRIAQIVYFQFDGNDSGVCIFGLTLPWDGDFVEIGENLLKESIASLRMQNIERIECRCDSDDPHHQEILTVLEKAGFQLIQEKNCYLLTEISNVNDDNRPLVFKTLDAVGEDRFINAIMQVTVKTLDRADQSDIDHEGAEQAARDYFNLLKSIDDNPEHWVLAYDTDHHLLGLVVAQVLSEKTGCINYIGVVPEFRGHNYSKDLILKATTLLRNITSIKRIIADIDAENFPLERTLVAFNYQKTKTMWVYHKRFNGLTDG